MQFGGGGVFLFICLFFLDYQIVLPMVFGIKTGVKTIVTEKVLKHNQYFAEHLL